MRWVLLLLGAALALVIVGWLVSALKWLLIVAALIVFLGVVMGGLPGQRASKHWSRR
ncbi:MAG: hypothetical protein H0V32_12230 [Nocardioidaceae bacterium]|jgi:hypothetical protein|nr:hypothetical protein [Nocardioidaceae bacterium]MBA3991637.1 hypothetical protein [Propionibacteriales bacterium]